MAFFASAASVRLSISNAPWYNHASSAIGIAAQSGAKARRTAIVMGNASIIQIQLNGEAYALPAPATVASLVAARQPRPPFAVEVNKQLVRRPNYGATELRDGDEVEIVTLVGGG
jgi:thiamine biosynthesis protein ThiS